MGPRKTKALARNADTEHHGFFKSCFPRKQRPLLGTPTRSTTAFSDHVFPRKQEPMLGTLIRDGELMCPTCPASDMVAEKISLHFWGQIATKVAKHVAEPIL